MKIEGKIFLNIILIIILFLFLKSNNNIKETNCFIKGKFINVYLFIICKNMTVHIL